MPHPLQCKSSICKKEGKGSLSLPSLMISISLVVAKGLMLPLVVFGLAVDLFSVCVSVCVIFLLKG